MSTQYKLKSTIKYPTSIVINGVSNLGLEIAESLLAQGGYVILIDSFNDRNLGMIADRFGNSNLLSFLDYSAIPHLEEDIRRLDYVFFLYHENTNVGEEVSTQSFLKYSNYLDTTLSLAGKFEAKFLLTTSIKAHQMLMSRMDFDVNFGLHSEGKHTVYTEMEVQRYAESLCLEYVTKTDLNARIVRLGEVIGEGMDFSENSTFVRLIIAAVSNQELLLYNDGLDTEWFVHMLDAAYGVIKAQFAKDTKGDMFSLAYESSVTHLSLAYKLQELEPLAKEISFKDVEGALPPLRFHKPAPNLSKIGWKPRVEFEKALTESLAAAKLYLMQDKIAQHSQRPSSGVVGKLKSFFAMAGKSPTPAELEMMGSGPVSRLIAERRRQEMSRVESMDRADTTLKDRWRDRPRTPSQKVKAWIWRNFLDVRTNFAFLRHMTPGQFVSYLAICVILVIGYFAIFSPVVTLGRNAVVMYSSWYKLQTGLTSYDFATVYREAGTMESALRENTTVLNNFSGAANILGARKFLDSAIAHQEVYAGVFEGLKDLSYSVEPITKYLNNYKDNTRFRVNTDSYLSISENGTDYSSALEEMTARSAYAEVGETKFSQAVLQISALDSAIWPEFIRNALQRLNSRLSGISAVADYRQTAEHTDEILGVGQAKTYLIILVDNSRPMPIGGELSAYMLLTLQNGSVADIRVQSIDSLDFSLAEVPDFTLSAINLMNITPKAKKDLALRDLGYIADYSVFADTVGELWSEAFNRRVDATMIMNYSALAGIADLLGGVPVESETITSDNMLRALSTLQSQTETSARRNDLAAQLMAKEFEIILDNLSTAFVPILGELSISALRKDLVIPQNDMNFNQVIVKSHIDGGLLEGADLPVSMAIISDPKVISPQKLPAVNMSSNIKVNPDSSIEYSVVFKFPALSNVDLASICTSLAATGLKLEGVPEDKFKLTKFNNQQCLVADITDQTELRATWQTVQFESLEQKEYNVVLGQSKASGLEVVSDIEIRLSPGLSFQSIQPTVSTIEGRAVFTQQLANDQLIDLVINK